MIQLELRRTMNFNHVNDDDHFHCIIVISNHQVAPTPLPPSSSTTQVASTHPMTTKTVTTSLWRRCHHLYCKYHLGHYRRRYHQHFFRVWGSFRGQALCIFFLTVFFFFSMSTNIYLQNRSLSFYYYYNNCNDINKNTNTINVNVDNGHNGSRCIWRCISSF